MDVLPSAGEQRELYAIERRAIARARDHTLTEAQSKVRAPKVLRAMIDGGAKLTRGSLGEKCHLTPRQLEKVMVSKSFGKLLEDMVVVEVRRTIPFAFGQLIQLAKSEDEKIALSAVKFLIDRWQVLEKMIKEQEPKLPSKKGLNSARRIIARKTRERTVETTEVCVEDPVSPPECEEQSPRWVASGADATGDPGEKADWVADPDTDEGAEVQAVHAGGEDPSADRS